MSIIKARYARMVEYKKEKIDNIIFSRHYFSDN